MLFYMLFELMMLRLNHGTAFSLSVMVATSSSQGLRRDRAVSALFLVVRGLPKELNPVAQIRNRLFLPPNLLLKLIVCVRHIVIVRSDACNWIPGV